MWLWVDNIGTIYVTDFSNHRVQKWNYGATAGTTIAGTGVIGNAANQLYYPQGIWLDPAGNMYVNDQNNFRMQKFSPGAPTGITIAGGNGIGSALNQFNFTTDITVDGSNNLYVADFLNHRVVKWAPGATNGVIVAGTGVAGTAPNQVNGPYGLYLDKDTLYMTEVYNNRVTKWLPGATTGIVVAGGNGIGSAANQFRDPEGIIVDRIGNIYIGDVSNHRLQKWAPGATSGITVAGTGSAGSGPNELAKPTGLRLNDSGYLYTVEWTNNRVQRFTPYINDSLVATVTGTYTAYIDGFNGCRDTVTYVVRPALLPAITASGPVNFCDGDDVTLSATPAGSIYTYQWIKDATNVGSNSSTYQATVSGSYKVIVTDTSGCYDSSNTITVQVQPLPVVSLGRDTGICSTGTLVLRSPQPAGSAHLWNNGSAADSLPVNSTGTYWLRVTYRGCSATDTIKVTVVPAPILFIGNDTIICESTPLSVGSTVPNAAYEWNTGANTPFIKVSVTGMYWLKADIAGCIVIDTANITAMPDPDINLGQDSDLCFGQTIILNATYPNSTYLWSTGANTATLQITEAGLYWVHVTSEFGCTSGDTIRFQAVQKPVVQLGQDTTVCEETPLQLKPEYIIHEDSIRWSDGSVAPLITVTSGGTYTVQAINKCGTASDTIQIRQIFCDIWMPNAFTPNGDGSNDILKAMGNLGRLQHFGLSVYNRWGERVFFTSDKYKGWDGIYRGDPCPVGAYVYMLEYNLEDQPVMQTGSVTLLR
jgi:gliding motility-associated-like protein